MHLAAIVWFRDVHPHKTMGLLRRQGADDKPTDARHLPQARQARGHTQPGGLSPMKTSRIKTQRGKSLMRSGCLFLVSFAMATALFFSAAPLRASETMAEKVDDAAITNEVKKSLYYHFSLNFHVKTQEGVVTLSGEASNAAEKELNTKLATAIRGVKRVVNNMVVPVNVAGNN
jgi:hypothetical protein